MLNSTKLRRLTDREKEVNGARQVVALLPRLVLLAVTEQKDATATRVSRESAVHLTSFGSALRDHAPLCWQRVAEYECLGGKRPRVRDYRNETAVLLHDRPRDVKGDPHGRIQIALLGSIAGRRPGMRETFAELEYRQLGDVHWGHQNKFGGTIVRKNVWRLAFDGAVALAAAWIERLNQPELSEHIVHAKNTLLVEEIMES